MAYNGANLTLNAEGIGGTSPQFWSYTSTDAITTTRAANYISDALGRGMKVRDVVYVFDTSTPTTYICSVLTVGSTGADLSDGVAITESNS